MWGSTLISSGFNLFLKDTLLFLNSLSILRQSPLLVGNMPHGCPPLYSIQGIFGFEAAEPHVTIDTLNLGLWGLPLVTLPSTQSWEILLIHPVLWFITLKKFKTKNFVLWHSFWGKIIRINIFLFKAYVISPFKLFYLIYSFLHFKFLDQPFIVKILMMR